MLEPSFIPTFVYRLIDPGFYWANAAAIELWEAQNIEELLSRDCSSDSMTKTWFESKIELFREGCCVPSRWTIYPNGHPKRVYDRSSAVLLETGELALFCQMLEDDQDTSDEMSRMYFSSRYSTVSLSIFDPSLRLLTQNLISESVFSMRQGSELLSRYNLPAEDIERLKSLCDIEGELMYQVCHKDRWYKVSAKSVPDPISDNKMILIEEKDVTDFIIAQNKLNHTNKKLEHLSTKDPLTGLFNRRYLESSLKSEFNLVKRRTFKECSSYNSALVLIDIDHFKNINDTYGHSAGDKVLQDLSSLLTESFRATDIICRWGGEEFCILMKGVDENNFLSRLTDLLESVGRTNFSFQEMDISITVSVGTALLSGFTLDSIDELVVATDKALYISKESGRNQVSVFIGNQQFEGEPHSDYKLSKSSSNESIVSLKRRSQ
ncbi:MAG: GGDEF domain-containing protein [Oceanospirillaceae bacterium]|nr:GGDEF domain-containing protein [Oceanospirillaceae bacterium]